MKTVFILLIIFISATFFANGQMKSLPLKDSTLHVDSSFLKRRMFFSNPNPMLNYNYYNTMGVMCKVEYKMQRALKVPLCLRLGSLEECKKMETIAPRYDR